MTTPRKAEIVEKAKELWHQDRVMNGDPAFDITPTQQELRENGFLSVAQSELMRHKHRSEIESQFIDFAQDFSVDLTELYESNGLVLGSRHTGKSDIAMMISERAMKENTTVVCFDPSLDWIKRSSIKQYLKVESYTSLQIPKESIIYDLSLCSPLQAQKIVEDFNEKLFESQAQAFDRKQYLVIFEEAHTYFYEGSMRSKKMQNSVKLLSVGRNVDIAVLLISQFASMLSKFSIKHSTSQAWFGYTKEKNDIAYLKSFLGENVKELTKLDDGQFMFMDRNGISKIAIEPYNSTTPKQEVKMIELKPIIEPIKPKQTNDSQALLNLLAMFIYALVILAIIR